MIRRHRGRRDHHLGAVGLEQAHLLLRHLVRHREDAAVALERRRDGEADAGVAAGALDDRPAGLELARSLGGLDDREPDPVLHRPAGIGVLRLAVDRGANPGADAAQPDQRRPADGVEHGVVRRGMRVAHGVISVRAGLRKWIGWRNGAATGGRRAAPAQSGARGAAASAAESSAGYPLDSAMRVESRTSVPCTSAYMRSDDGALDARPEQRRRDTRPACSALSATGGSSPGAAGGAAGGRSTGGGAGSLPQAPRSVTTATASARAWRRDRSRMVSTTKITPSASFASNRAGDPAAGSAD